MLVSPMTVGMGPRMAAARSAGGADFAATSADHGPAIAGRPPRAAADATERLFAALRRAIKARQPAALRMRFPA